MPDLVVTHARAAMINMAEVAARQIFAGREDCIPASHEFVAAMVDLIDSRIIAATGAAP